MAAKDVFAVFELGFGAGINFLTLFQTFTLHNQKGRLRFFSCESAPLPKSILRQVIRDSPVPVSIQEEFLEQYPPPVAGIHRRWFRQGRIELTVFYCSAKLAVEDFVTRDFRGVDAWFLDGFAPDRNPDMWDPTLISLFATRTLSGGTLTTYSVAGRVRRALESSGFHVTKVPSAPHKRHTTLARLACTPFESLKPFKKVKVVGGGFAGCATARALAQKGFDVQLQTPTGVVGNATSGIPTAICHARLSASDEASSHLRTQAYLYAVNYYTQVDYGNTINRCGAIHIPFQHMPKERLAQVIEMLGKEWACWKSLDEIREVAGCDLGQEATYFPNSLVVKGADLCEWLSNHSRIEVVKEEFNESDQFNGVTVLATGSLIPDLQLNLPLEITTLKGQVDEFRSAKPNQGPKATVLYDGYIAPSTQTVAAGSTYEYVPWEDGKATQRNRDRLNGLFGHTRWEHVSSFRGSRAITSDRLPIAGSTDEHMWLNLGHGSSGTTSAPFTAEIIASQIAHELPPLSPRLVPVLSPRRFAIRQQRRPNPFTKVSHP